MTHADRGSRSRRRLAEELHDDRVDLGDEAVAAVLVDELDYARRAPMFEGRRPIYGAIVTTDPGQLRAWSAAAVDLVEVRGDLDGARAFADGRSSYLVRNPRDPSRVMVACFDRTLQYEADLVLLQEAIGATIVQRTAVLGVTRLFQSGRVVSWDGNGWTGRPTARSLLPDLQSHAHEVEADVAQGVLTLAVHWLAPARVGATLVLGHDGADGSLDRSSAVDPPQLTVTNRQHLPPLLSCLMQRDLATLVDRGGGVHAIGVGLLSSAEADAVVNNAHGMRHRSAQRWSFDHPEAVLTVVSSDGPVTVYKAGEPIISSRLHSPAAPPSGTP